MASAKCSGNAPSVEVPTVERIPSVRIAEPKGRPMQLRYFDPAEQREVRISANTYDRAEAERQKKELEAKLLLGLDTKRPAKPQTGPGMPWEVFREQYSRVQLATIRDRSAVHAESRLDLAERIIRPKTLGDMAQADTLHRLQSELLAGTESRRGKPRSAYTVKTHVGAVLTALRWAELQGWLSSVPRIRKVKTAKLKAMKGRPITGEEFDRMLDKTASIVGESAAESWRHVLRGLWTSALRLDELMHVSWDISNTITPEWKRDRLPVLCIPAELQKNATEEDIPLLPWFEAVLLETPEEQRTGWAFNPASTEERGGRKARQDRLDAEWVGRVISRIGKAAGIIVDPGDKRTEKPVKYASAHDLRRSCAERLQDAGVPPLVICRVLRHASWETTRKHYAPGNVQKDAGILRERLANVPGCTWVHSEQRIDASRHAQKTLNA